MLNVRLLLGASLLSVATVLAAQSSTLALPASQISYEALMQLPRQERAGQFASLTAEHKAQIKRTHAERWLAANRTKLTSSQIALMREALEFISAGIYTRPDDPSIRATEEALKDRLVCELGQEHTRAAFLIDAPPEPPRTWRSASDAWLGWFTECVVG